MPSAWFCVAITLISLWSLPAYQHGNDRKQLESFPHESNEWQVFSDWASNSPRGRQHSAATTAVERRPSGRDQEVMFMYGGVRYDPDNTTWLYEPDLRAWRGVKTAVWPPSSSYHSLVTLCRRRVILFGGAYDHGNGKCSNETWAFHMIRKKWTRIHDSVGKGERYVTPRCRHTATALRRPHVRNNVCECMDSMIVYSGLAGPRDTWYRGLGDLWELRCVSDRSHDNFVYEWVQLLPKGNQQPKMHSPQLVSVFDNTLPYFYGKVRSMTDFGQFSWEVWSCEVSVDGYTRWFQRFTHSKSGHESKLIYLTGGIGNGSFHFLVPCCAQPLVAFNIMANDWFVPLQIPHQGKLPQLDSMSVAVVAIGQSLLAFGGSQKFFGYKEDILWNLTFHRPDLFIWSLGEIQARSPLAGRAMSVGGIIGDNRAAIIFGGSGLHPVTNEPQFTNDLQRLNFETMRWSVDPVDLAPPFAFGAAGCILGDSVLVVFGGSVMTKIENWKNIDVRSDTWGYYSNDRAWIKFELDERPRQRVFSTAVSVTDNEMILFGGGTIVDSKKEEGVRRLCEVWSFQIPSTSTNLSVARHGSRWRMLSSSGPKSCLHHSLVSIGKKLLLYGGNGEPNDFADIPKLIERRQNADIIRLGAHCVDDLWEYDLDTNTWEKVNYTGDGPGRRCVHSAVVYAGNMIVFGGCSGYAEVSLNTNSAIWDFNCPVEASSTGLWSYNRALRTWLRHSKEPAAYEVGVSCVNVVWKQWILSFGGMSPREFKLGEIAGDRAGFSVFRPACPPGTEGNDFEVGFCTKCGIGNYSAVSGGECASCPEGLTTSHTGSKSREDCSQCIDGYCVHGSCTAAIPGPTPLCQCQIGYTKDEQGRCTSGLYFIAGSGFLAGICLLLAVVMLAMRHIRARRLHKAIVQGKDDRIVELAQGWNVDSRELRLRRRIDAASPGGYGDVYLAEYRELTVAVKKLKGIHQCLERLELEFEREIEIMRSIRHPNIVLFLGGGRYHDDGCPFLVIEFMTRGTLTSILRTATIPFDNSLKMRFALDASKGMRFLHSLRPPRVHRDLKCANLLVSERWVVKVADFGTARLVRDEGVNQESLRGESPLDSSLPLLQAESQMSSDVGTPCWSSPEILCAAAYGTATDVYSFGIVLWEIVTRQEPYNDRKFRSMLDLTNCVLGGVRPTVPTGLNPDIVQLMRDCWQGNSRDRPTFGDVVCRLENINERLLLPSGP